MSFTIAIIGRPNVGKSTLFNRLVGQKLALVDDEPGVTRDRREGNAHLGDLEFTVIDTAGLDEARKISLRHTAHVSRNARRGDPDGRHERFVTQRCHACGRPEARRRLDALLAELTTAGLPIVEVEQEYVALDSNPAVDTGWISA